MILAIKLFLTAIAGLGIFALVNWVAISQGYVMERYRRILLAIASVPLSLLTIWWVSHQLEERVPSQSPNVGGNRPAEAEGRSEPASAACRRSG